MQLYSIYYRIFNDTVFKIVVDYFSFNKIFFFQLHSVSCYFIEIREKYHEFQKYFQFPYQISTKNAISNPVSFLQVLFSTFSFATIP